MLAGVFFLGAAQRMEQMEQMEQMFRKFPKTRALRDFPKLPFHLFHLFHHHSPLIGRLPKNADKLSAFSGRSALHSRSHRCTA